MARLYLTQVSRGWRCAALATPSLWSSLLYCEDDYRRIYTNLQRFDLDVSRAARFGNIHLALENDLVLYWNIPGYPLHTSQKAGKVDWTRVHHLLETRRGDVATLSLLGCQSGTPMTDVLEKLGPGGLPNLRSLSLLSNKPLGGTSCSPAWLQHLYDSARDLTYLKIVGERFLPNNAPSAIRSLVLVRACLAAEDVRTLASFERLHTLGLATTRIADCVGGVLPLPALETLILEYDVHHSTATHYAEDVGSIARFIRSLHTPQLRHLKVGHGRSVYRKASANAVPVEHWQALADTRWPISTLQLPLGQGPAERAAQLDIVRSVSGSLGTLVCPYAALDQLVQPDFPALPQLSELVVLDRTGSEPGSALTLLRTLRTLQRGESLPRLSKVRYLSSVRTELAERAREEPRELRAWARLGREVGELCTSWREAPFVHVHVGVGGGGEEEEGGWEGPRAWRAFFYPARYGGRGSSLARVR
ncbi:hypothetical protein CALCODRAFT_497567 [Calocera cornea HHB12733]|uniref:F-box domain-containing protein n=1 Tax=Calocera cornea HHB12733 TaxID=1353952 RepID=A0A165F615_9BASI|nr:hypothetical protein CALCODRAFT_497567 [Calocera cornea HHB12733]